MVCMCACACTNLVQVNRWLACPQGLVGELQRSCQCKKAKGQSYKGLGEVSRKSEHYIEIQIQCP